MVTVFDDMVQVKFNLEKLFKFYKKKKFRFSFEVCKTTKASSMNLNQTNGRSNSGFKKLCSKFP